LQTVFVDSLNMIP